MIQNRLPDLRLEQRWTQAELASRVGVSRQTIVSLEKGQYEPSLRVAMRLAAAFCVTVEDVFTPDSGELAMVRRATP